MLYDFSSKKKAKAAPQNEAQERIAKSIAESCIRWQQHAADIMQRRSEQLSKRSKLVMLLLFSVLMTAYSICIVSLSLTGKPLFSFSVTKGKRLVHIGQAVNKNTKAAGIITKDEYKRIQHFKGYMDSLARSPAGRKVFDSIVSTRPGLMDSILFIENIYQTQSKK